MGGFSCAPGSAGGWKCCRGAAAGLELHKSLQSASVSPLCPPQGAGAPDSGDFTGRKTHPSTEPCSQLSQVLGLNSIQQLQLNFAQQIPKEWEHVSPRREKSHSHAQGKPGAKRRGEESTLSSPRGCRGVNNSLTLLHPQPPSCPNLEWPRSALIQSQA